VNIDWTAVRAGFPALTGRAFLNTATFGQLAQRTVDAITAHLAQRNDTACADFLTWFDHHDRLRAKLAGFIHAAPEDIAFLPNASAALGHLLAGLDWREGDEFLTLEGEFPNNLYATHFHAARGVRPVESTWERLFDSIHPRTRAVAVSTCNYVTGFRPPLEELSAECRRRGVLLYLDGTQSLGAWPFDFQAIQPAILAVNCYKWMLAPNGAAFMAVREDVRARIAPLSVGWRSDHDWRNVSHLHHGAPRFQTSAEKYEGGMLPSALLYGLEASLDLMNELGPAAIAQRVAALAAQCRGVLTAAGAEVLHPDTAILAARFPDRDAAALARELSARRILVSARHGCLRVSTHFYNDSSDIAALADALR
jgi:selenocysteine lyase/cysteine desulfurase